jgi:hypothetical protein
MDGIFQKIYSGFIFKQTAGSDIFRIRLVNQNDLLFFTTILTLLLAPLPASGCSR